MASLQTGSTIFVIDFPDDWTLLAELFEGRGIGALEPTRNPAFAGNIVLIAEDIGGMSFPDWQDSADRLLSEALDGYLLIDAQVCEVAGRRGGRRLAHYASDSGVSVTMEQWFTALDGVGMTITGSVDTLRYPSYSELFRMTLATLTISDGLGE